MGSSTIIFTLLPMSDGARRIVDYLHDRGNRRLLTKLDGKRVICVETSYRSRRSGNLLTFGRSDYQDVFLPEPYSAQDQCAFFVTPVGELMIRDATTGHHTRLECRDKNGIQEKYSLQGDPRHRAIPYSNDLHVSLSFGREISFQFAWHRDIARGATTDDHVRKQLVEVSINNAPSFGYELPIPRDPNLEPTAYEARTDNTPMVPKDLDGKPMRQIHVYKTLGSGAFGTVSKAVDLATGRIWAVKECTSPKHGQAGEKWKAEFKREVEKLAQLRHSHIVHLEHHQGWSLGRPVQIFLELCTGSVEDILPRHKCLEQLSRNVERWVPRFVSQVLDGLAYMHACKMVHRDLKPQNILYQRRSDGELDFFISDFGLAVSQGSIKGIAGTWVYMAPESSREGKCGPESDVYSFGIMLLQVVNKFCPKEILLSESDWRKKLKANNARDAHNYRDYIPKICMVLEPQRGHSRVQSLVDNELLPSAVCKVLVQNPAQRATATQAQKLLMARYPSEGAAGLPREPEVHNRREPDPRDRRAPEPPRDLRALDPRDLRGFDPRNLRAPEPRIRPMFLEPGIHHPAPPRRPQFEPPRLRIRPAVDTVDIPIRQHR